MSLEERRNEGTDVPATLYAGDALTTRETLAQAPSSSGVVFGSDIRSPQERRTEGPFYGPGPTLSESEIAALPQESNRTLEELDVPDLEGPLERRSLPSASDEGLGLGDEDTEEAGLPGEASVPGEADEETAIENRRAQLLAGSDDVNFSGPSAEPENGTLGSLLAGSD